MDPFWLSSTSADYVIFNLSSWRDLCGDFFTLIEEIVVLLIIYDLYYFDNAFSFFDDFIFKGLTYVLILTINYFKFVNL